MAINGTALLLYINGIAVAVQKGISIAVDTDLPDATNKESQGWAQHINGLMNAKIDFSALFISPLVIGASDMNALELMNTIINNAAAARIPLLVSILGLGYPIIGQADLSSLSFDANQESPMSLSGSVKIDGPLYVLSNIGGMPVNLVTDPQSGGKTYDTFTYSGTTITSAIKSTGGAEYTQSNVISVANGGVYKFAVFLTLTSGQAPTVGIWDNTSAYISNTQQLVAGLNFITLTATSTDASSSLRLSNNSNGNWATTPIYLFRVS